MGPKYSILFFYIFKIFFCFYNNSLFKIFELWWHWYSDRYDINNLFTALFSVNENENVLGHEITHGFDDVGRMFDKDGVYFADGFEENLWSNE